MIQDLLHIIQREAAKDGQAAVEPDALAPHQGPRRGDGHNQRCEAADCDDGHAGQEGTAQVEVFFLLGGCADEGDAAHHGDGVETGAGEEGGLEEEEGGEDAGLGDVEGGPEGVFGDVARESVSLVLVILFYFLWIL